MSGLTWFCLGVGAAVVAIVIVALVVIVLKLMRKTKWLDDTLQTAFRDIQTLEGKAQRSIQDLKDEMAREIKRIDDSETGETHLIRDNLSRDIIDAEHRISTSIADIVRQFQDDDKVALDAAKSYTDSRIDKALTK